MEPVKPVITTLTAVMGTRAKEFEQEVLRLTAPNQEAMHNALKDVFTKARAPGQKRYDVTATSLQEIVDRHLLSLEPGQEKIVQLPVTIKDWGIGPTRKMDAYVRISRGNPIGDGPAPFFIGVDFAEREMRPQYLPQPVQDLLNKMGIQSTVIPTMMKRDGITQASLGHGHPLLLGGETLQVGNHIATIPTLPNGSTITSKWTTSLVAPDLHTKIKPSSPIASSGDALRSKNHKTSLTFQEPSGSLEEFDRRVSKLMPRLGEKPDPNITNVTMWDGQSIEVIPGEAKKMLTAGLSTCQATMLLTQHPNGKCTAILTHYPFDDLGQNMDKLAELVAQHPDVKQKGNLHTFFVIAPEERVKNSDLVSQLSGRVRKELGNAHIDVKPLPYTYDPEHYSAFVVDFPAQIGNSIAYEAFGVYHGTIKPRA